MSDAVIGLYSGEFGADDEPVTLHVKRKAGHLVFVAKEQGDTVNRDEGVTTDDLTDRNWFGKFGNDTAQAVEYADPEAVKTGFNKARSRLLDALDEEESDIADKMTPAAIEELREATESVEFHRGDPSVVSIEFERTVEGTDQTATATVEFDQGEWTSNSKGKLKEQFFGLFRVELDITDEVWEAIKDEWNDQMETTTIVAHTEDEETIVQVINGVARRIRPVADKEALKNSKFSAWYEPNARNGEDVLWVRSTAVREQLENATGEMQFNTLARKLQSEDYAFDSACQRATKKVYPFIPERIDVGREDVAGLGDDEADENDAEAGDAGAGSGREVDE